MARLRDTFNACRTMISASRQVAQCKKGTLAQLIELVPLRIKNAVGITEYYEFCLWDDSRFRKKDKLSYGGWRRESEVDRLANSREHFAIVNEKFLFEVLMSACGVPTPKTLAFLSRDNFNYGDHETLNSVSQIASFLQSKAEFPLYAKPVDFSGGHGGTGIDSLVDGGNKLRLINGEVLCMTQWLAQIETLQRDYVFQECLRSSDNMRLQFGRGLTTLRMITLLNGKDVRVFRTIWKLPLGSNMHDNFSRGKSGNLAAMVNRDTGIVERVVSGMGIDQKIHEEHPETGRQMVGYQIPDYEVCREAVVRGARALPRLRVLHWDVALSHRGPMILEANIYGCNFLAQIAGPPGFWDDEFKLFLRDLSLTAN